MEQQGSAKTQAFNYYSLLRNILVVLICSLGIGGSLLLFRQDLNKTEKILSEEPVGTVYWSGRLAQRLSPRHLQWARIERFSPVYNGETVATAALSSLKISFSGGEILELAENTSVRILYQNEGKIRFELSKGEIQVSSSRTGIEIAVEKPAPANEGEAAPGIKETIVVTLEPRTNVSVKAGKGCTFKVYQGAGTFVYGDESRQVQAGRSLKLGEDGVFLPEPPLVVLSPRNGTRLLRTSRGKAAVKFTWQTAEDSPVPAADGSSPAAGNGSRGKGSVWLEVAGNSDFSQLVGSWYSEGGNSKEIDLDVGTYYWRVYVSQTEPEVDSGRLDIVYTPGPRAISPANGSVQTVENDMQELRFSWFVPEEADAVLLEVAANPDMSKPRLRQMIKRTARGRGSYVSSGLGPGKWYWRVTPVYPGGVTGAENSGSQGGQTFWRIRQANADVVGDDFPSPVNGFTLSDAKPESGQTTGAGTYVVVIESGDNPRIIFPYDNYMLEAACTPDLFFSWKNPIAYSNKARFQISKRSDFTGKLTVDEEVSGSGIQGVFLKPGTYYWHVISTDPADSSGSIPTRLVVTPSLAAPNLVAPRENERLLIEGGKPVIFSWERPYYAGYFKYSLFLEGRDIPLAEITSLQNNSLQVYFDPYSSGRFRWTVQGFASPTETSSGRTGLIAQGLFTITPQGASGAERTWKIPVIKNIETYSGEVHSPITLLSPAKGVNIQGLLALRSPPEARWRSQDPLRNVQLIVSRSSDPTSDPGAIVKDAGATSATLPSLGEGLWYWIIRGDTNNGRGATPGDPFWFTVLPIPQLPVPEAIEPAQDSVIGIAQLTRDRNITFRWNETENANAYIFSLFYDADPPKLVLATKPEAMLFYVLDNLSLLSQGKYLWQVEAVSVNSGGVIEQRGSIEQHAFTIDIQRSSNLQTRPQGTMYGQ